MPAVTKMLPNLMIGLAIAVILSTTAIMQARSTTAPTASVVARPAHLEPPLTRAKPTWNEMNVPQHSAWARNILLIIVWMFVLAVLAGPLVKYAASRRPLPRPPAGGAW